MAEPTAELQVVTMEHHFGECLEGGRLQKHTTACQEECRVSNSQVRNLAHQRWTGVPTSFTYSVANSNVPSY